MTATAAHAVPVVDQSNILLKTLSDTVTSAVLLGTFNEGTEFEQETAITQFQTFTAGIPGQLTGVDLQLIAITDRVGVMNMTLYDGIRDDPASSAIARISFSTDELPNQFENGQFFNFDLSNFNIFIDTDDVFSIDLAVENQAEPGFFGAAWIIGEQNIDPETGVPGELRLLSYDRGFARGAQTANGIFEGYTPRVADRSFRTFVDPDAVIDVPAPGAIGLFGLGFLTLSHMRRRRR
ncbi:MAG: PEP-CTERM sorting domain-containing protein [Pseudomonadota bacterium]